MLIKEWGSLSVLDCLAEKLATILYVKHSCQVMTSHDSGTEGAAVKDLKGVWCVCKTCMYCVLNRVYFIVTAKIAHDKQSVAKPNSRMTSHDNETDCIAMKDLEGVFVS